jgi:hypothetical protein
MFTTLISLSVIGLVGGAAASLIIVSMKNGVSPMPSMPRARRCVVSVVRELVKGSASDNAGSATAGSHDTEDDRSTRIIEAGSGWGTLAVPLAQALPQCHITGVENSPVPCWTARLYARLRGVRNITFLRKRFETVAFSGVRIVVAYLSPDGMEMIKKKIEEECRAETVYVVSHTFHVPGWQPDAVYPLPDIYRSNVYVYRVLFA